MRQMAHYDTRVITQTIETIEIRALTQVRYLDKHSYYQKH